MEFNPNYPLYVQVAEHIRLEIVRGALEPGQRMLAIRELAALYKVVPNTIVKALEQLASEELVYARRTSGYFVTEDEDAIAKVRHEENSKIIGEFYHKMQLCGYGKEEVIRMVIDYTADDKEKV